MATGFVFELLDFQSMFSFRTTLNLTSLILFAICQIYSRPFIRCYFREKQRFKISDHGNPVHIVSFILQQHFPYCHKSIHATKAIRALDGHHNLLLQLLVGFVRR